MVKKAPRKKTPSPNGHFLDGTITIEVQGGPHDGKTLYWDATIVKQAADVLVAKHSLPIEDGCYQPSPEFLMALDERFKELGYDSTPTIAAHAWAKATDYFVELQKKTKPLPS